MNEAIKEIAMTDINIDILSPITYPSVCDQVARLADIRVEMAGETAEEAVEKAARVTLALADETLTPGKGHALSDRETLSWQMLHAVCSDVLNGTVSRSSVGNVRERVRSLMADKQDSAVVESVEDVEGGVNVRTCDIKAGDRVMTEPILNWLADKGYRGRARVLHRSRWR